MTNCAHEGCSNSVFLEQDKCALHCEKHDFHTDWQSGLIKEFYLLFLEFCVNDINNSQTKNEEYNKKVKDFLRDKNKNKLSIEKNSIKNTYNFGNVLFVGNIKFPESNSNYELDYFNFFYSFLGIHFDQCDIYFYLTNDQFQNTHFFFQDCNFFNSWYITPIKRLSNYMNCLYQNCMFYKDVRAEYEAMVVPNEDITLIPENLFYACRFIADLSLAGMEFTGLVFIEEDSSSSSSIEHLNIQDCSFKKDVIIQEHFINEMRISNSSFTNIYLRKNGIVKAEMLNCKIEKMFDASYTDFNILYIKDTIFSSIVNFEKSKFGIIISDAREAKPVIFENVTFLGIANFRNTIFYEGLDIEKINAVESPNFLGTRIEPNYTKRDTFRLIKYSFDRIGNHLEANKYFREEMVKYKEELQTTGTKAQRFVFWFNSWSSDFGQSYTLPLKRMFYFILIPYSILFFLHKYECLYKMYTPLNSKINAIAEHINDIAKLFPLNNTLVAGMELISLGFNIFFGLLGYQLIIALKRNAKR